MLFLESTKSPLAIGSSRNDSWCFAVHAKLGSLPIEAILKPIELAERGVIVTEKQEERLNHYHDELNKTNGPNSVLSKVYKKKIPLNIQR
jgi:gamma-glutamyltranspeptidase/glutathione hydrolase